MKLLKNPKGITTSCLTHPLILRIRFSGSDMSNLVKDAVYGPVRKCQLAKHFARIIEGNTTKYMPVLEKDLNKWHPSQIVQKTLTDLSGDELKVPDVDMVQTLFYILF